MCRRGAAEARHESPYSCVASTASCRAVAHVSGRGSGVYGLGAGALHGMRAVGIDAASPPRYPLAREAGQSAASQAHMRAALTDRLPAHACVMWDASVSLAPPICVTVETTPVWRIATKVSPPFPYWSRVLAAHAHSTLICCGRLPIQRWDASGGRASISWLSITFLPHHVETRCGSPGRGCETDSVLGRSCRRRWMESCLSLGDAAARSEVGRGLRGGDS